MNEKKYESVDARPVKRFFVEMLTRDIQLEDAILDLLDNCIDGILRSSSDEADPEKPYRGYWAKITANEKIFEIEDNCGGIPWDKHDQAFRMGRPLAANNSADPAVSGGVGVYGIGMKRAIFKMGNDALIWTQNGDDAYEVTISAEWLKAEDNWDLDVKTAEKEMVDDGTYIAVENLDDDVAEYFSAEKFTDDLLGKIAKHYSVILHRGFTVEVNGKKAVPMPIEFRFAVEKSGDSEVRPYIFKSTYDEVEVFLSVGLREPIPGVEKALEEQEGVKFSSNYAGWTVICNDRVVLYCNKDELTGWGLFGLPRYHPQFTAISGVVEFRGKPQKLPTTTTKRGLKFDSKLYQRTLTRMREGLRLFIDFTNKWKALESEAKNIVSPIPSLTFSQVKTKADTLSFRKTRTGLKGEQFKPKLPMPTSISPDTRISYMREKVIVLELADKLLPDLEDIREKDIPRKVGEATFDKAYKELLEENE